MIKKEAEEGDGDQTVSDMVVKREEIDHSEEVSEQSREASADLTQVDNSIVNLDDGAPALVDLTGTDSIAPKMDTSGEERFKVRVSPRTYKAMQQAIEVLQRESNSTLKIIENLQQKYAANYKEIQGRQRMIAMWEVDENLSVKSFGSAHNSCSLRIDESVEEVRVPPQNVPTTSKQAMAGVDDRDRQ